MLDWIKKWRRTRNRPEPDTDVAQRRRSALSGKYLLLYKYLDGRYADSVVLTFAQIEDLLGFKLPETARQSEAWWTSPDQETPKPRFSDSWILANRTAQPNLAALTVVFERAF